MHFACKSLTKIDIASLDVYRDYSLMIDNNDYFGLSSFTMSDDNNMSENSRFSSIFTDELVKFSFPAEEIDPQLPQSDFSVTVGDSGFDEMAMFVDEGENRSPQYLSLGGEDKATLSPSMESCNISLTDVADIGKQLSMSHLVRAYVEAMDQDQVALAKIIVNRVREKVSIVGGAIERLLFYLFQYSSDKQASYLKEESLRNFTLAFKTFYQIFPYGKFAHFAANQSILKAMPWDVGAIHIIDFDIGGGVQWPSLIEAFSGSQIEIRLTSIKWREGDLWRFEKTKSWLLGHAQAFGVNFTIDSMDLGDLICDMKKMKKHGGRREWLAFNCMLGLPHMGKVRTRSDVAKFMMAAKDLLGCHANSSYGYQGIITFGDGDAVVEPKCSYGSFLDVHFAHYQALLESIEWAFPPDFGEARTALESLFVAPLASSMRWTHKWEEVNDFDVQIGCEIQPNLQVSKEILMESKEMVREGSDNLYEVTVEGKDDDIIFLKWSGTTLVKVSSWVS